MTFPMIPFAEELSERINCFEGDELDDFFAENYSFIEKCLEVASPDEGDAEEMLRLAHQEYNCFWMRKMIIDLILVQLL